MNDAHIEIYEAIKQSLPSREDIEKYMSEIFDRYVEGKYHLPADSTRYFELQETFFERDLVGRILIRLTDECLVSRLKTRLEAGRLKLGLLYGTGHGPGPEDYLLNEAGFRVESEAWLTNRS